jgi:hypothetical protein
MSLSTQLALALAAAIGFAASPNVSHSQSAACAHRTAVPTDSTALAVETAWASASASHDTAALRCILADDFVDTNWRGVSRTRREMLSDRPNTPTGLEQHYSGFTVVRYDSTAIVRGLNTITNADHVTVATLRFTDVLRFSNGRWRAVAAEETPVQRPEAPKAGVP